MNNSNHYNKAEIQREYVYVASSRVSSSFKNSVGADALIGQFIEDVQKACGVDCSAWRKVDISEQIEVKTKYNNSLSDDKYKEMDDMIRNGYTNSEIAIRTGVHRNTVSRRRSKVSVNSNKL